MVGWGGRDRTFECWNQNPVPYHLATPQQVAGGLPGAVPYKAVEGGPQTGKIAALPQGLGAGCGGGGASL